MKKTERGFIEYGEFTDVYGANVRVQESSIATKKCVWIFVDSERDKQNNGAIHLDEKSAKTLIKHLTKFLKVHRFGASK